MAIIVATGSLRAGCAIGFEDQEAARVEEVHVTQRLS